MAPRSHPGGRGAAAGCVATSSAKGVVREPRSFGSARRGCDDGLKQGEPALDRLVFAGFDDRNSYHREWRRLYQRAEIGKRALKDLRGSYASQLLSCGVPLAYVSA